MSVEPPSLSPPGVQNVIQAVEDSFMSAWSSLIPLLERRGDQAYFNLRETIRRTLIDAGLPPQNITVEEVCTADNLDLFYSHRAEKGRCGLFGAVDSRSGSGWTSNSLFANWKLWPGARSLITLVSAKRSCRPRRSGAVNTRRYTAALRTGSSSRRGM